MIIDPKYVEFQHRNDVVDYVSRGLFPPRQAYYESLKKKVENPDPVVSSSRNGKEVQLHQDVIPVGVRNDMIDVLDRIYENRRRNVKKVVYGVGAALAAITTGVVIKKGKERKRLKEIKKRLDAMDRGEIDYIEF